MAVPENADALLTRDQTAKALAECGFPTSPKTLATKASRGGGPPYRLYGRVPLYRWGDSLAWAKERLSPPVRSTAEAGLALDRRHVRNQGGNGDIPVKAA
jgi:hypothetical protein